MNITRENIDELNAVIKVLIEKSDYEKNVADKLKDYRKKAALPGFRPGYVPASLIQKRFGKSILAEEVNQLLTQNLNNYLKEQELSILGEPLPSDAGQKPIDWDQDEDFEFAVEIGMTPPVNIILDKSRKFTYFTIKVTDEMIDNQVEHIRTQMGKNIPGEAVKEKSLVRGDFCQLDEDGNDLSGGICPQGVLVSTDLIKDEAIKNEFQGKKADDMLVFDPVAAFDNRHEVGHMLNISHEEAETLNGKFRFTINEVLDFEPAEINEAFFKKFYGENTEVKTVEAFREKIKADIASSFGYSSEQKFAADTRKKLIEETDVPLPEAFLKRWLKMANQGLSDEEIEKDFGSFLTDLQWQLIKNSISKANNLVVEEEEVNDYARSMALSQYQQYGIYDVTEENIDKLAKMILEKEDEKDRIYRRISEGKIMQVIKNQAEIDFQEISREEFSEMMK